MNFPPEQKLRPHTPAPNIDPVLLWPTPSKEDYLFYVERNGDLPVNQTWNHGEPYRDALKYPNHKLVHVAPQTPDKWSRWYYAADRLLQDEYNWEFSDADIGGTRFRAVTRTYLTPRADFDPLVPAMGDAMEDMPRDKFTGTFVLAKRDQQKLGDEILNGLYTAEIRTYVQKTQLAGVMVDEFSNTSNRVTVDLYYRGEVADGTDTVEDLFDDPTNAWWDAFTGVTGDTTTVYRREGKQLTTNWFSVETVPIIAGAEASGVITVHSYFTSVDYTWPAVLASLTLDEWFRRDGAAVRIWSPVYSKTQYSGPCKAQIVTKWSASPHTVAPASPPLPLPISIATPYFNISIPPTLHTGFTIVFTNGTTDPEFRYFDLTRTFPATNLTTWPVTLVVSDSQKPYKGGYLRETITVYSPT